MNEKTITATVAILVGSVCMASPQVKTIFLPEQYNMGDQNVIPIGEIDSAAWIWSGGDGNVKLFRNRFSGSGKLRLHVSADNRYVLKLDGIRIARGPERGTVKRWTYRTLEVELSAGEHVLEAVVDRMGEAFHPNSESDPRPARAGAPMAQLYWWQTGGFVLKAEGAFDAVLSTGKGAWKVKDFTNVHMEGDRGGSFGIGGSNRIEGCSPWFADMDDVGFSSPIVVKVPVGYNRYGCSAAGWRLYPTSLPQQLDEVKSPGAIRAVGEDFGRGYAYRAEDALPEKTESLNRLLGGEQLTIPANSVVNALWDLGDYYCAYPEVEVQGGKGAIIDFGWAESTHDAKTGLKGDRDLFIGRTLKPCFNDRFLPDGGRDGFTTTWWRSGRWIRFAVKTASEPLVVRRLSIAEVGYPTTATAKFACSDPTISPVIGIAARTMRMCSHEMSFDCPFYEQQMYPGDTRIQLLTHHVLAADDRLARRDMELYDFGRREDGRIGFNFPTTLEQDGTSYTYFWPMMLGDYALWRDNSEWLKARFPGLVHTMEGLHNFETPEGLVANTPGWNFMDWTDWPKGEYSCGNDKWANGTNAFENLLYVGALKSAARVAEALGENAFAAIYRARASRTSAEVERRFFHSPRGLLSNDEGHTCFSEHVNALAIVFDALSEERAAIVGKCLVADGNLIPTTVYFSHYLFEAYLKLGRVDLFLKRLDLWRGYVRKHLKTCQEEPDILKEGRVVGESRSDCHAWGAHPLYHLHTGVLGLKPSSLFFRTVEIAPQPGSLAELETLTPSPKGDIRCSLHFADGRCHGTVSLPAGLTGVFRWHGKNRQLAAGMQTIDL